MTFSIIIAAVVPLLFLYGIWALEIYALTRADLLVLALIWGGIAFFIALGINNSLLSGVFIYAQLVLLIAPLVEETLKAMLLAYFSNRMLMRYPVDGSVYGFAIGTGFALVENLHFITNNAADSLGGIPARVISVSLMHAFTAALVGTTLGANIYRSAGARLRFGTASVLLAVILHALFNFSVTVVSGISLIVVGVSIGLGSLFIIVLILRRTLEQESAFISTALRGQAEQGEIAAITRPDDVINILKQYHGELGEHRSQNIRDFLSLQAKRGNLTRTIARNQRKEFDSTLQQQLYSVDRELQIVEQKMGLYTRIWLRTILPSDETAVWDQLSGDTEQEKPVIALIEALNTRQNEISRDELQVRRDFLRHVSLFQSLHDDDLIDLSLLLKPISFPFGADVIKQSAPNDRLYFVRSGEILSSISDDSGKETVLNTYTFGTTFGETGLLDNNLKAPAQESVISSDGAELYYLERLDFITLIYGKPQVGLEMLRQMASRIRQHTDIIAWIRQNETGAMLTLPEPSLEVEENKRKSHVLIVDDAPTNRLMLTDMLEQLDFQATQAEDGMIALEMIEKDVPDLILLDIMMPRLDGFEVARRLKSNARTADIPIIFLTAVDDTNRIIEGLTLGAVDYVIKPFQPREVMARINTHLTIVHQKRMLIRQHEFIQRLYERERLSSNGEG